MPAYATLAGIRRHCACRLNSSVRPLLRCCTCGRGKVYIHFDHEVHLVRAQALTLSQHGLDFVDAPSVFAGLTFTFEDDRFSYQEQRFVTLGLLAGIPVSVVHTETAHEIRIISFRKATQREVLIYFSQVQD